LEGAAVEFELIHAACPPPFGSNGAGVARVFSFGLVVTNAQPHSRARRRISKMRNGSAMDGWACSVAVVCMVLPRSVVESEGNINQWLIYVNSRWLISWGEIVVT